MWIERLITVHDVEPEKLPADLRKHCTPQDLKAIRSGPDHFAKLARKAKYDWLRHFLEKCGECDEWHLEFASYGSTRYEPYFRFSWGGEPGICLPRGDKLPPKMPAVVKHLYSFIGGMRENKFGSYGGGGGVLMLRELSPLSDVGVWLSEKSEISPETAVPFLQSLSGDMLCYVAGNEGGWYRGGLGAIQSVKSLEEELAKYFGALLEGKRI